MSKVTELANKYHMQLHFTDNYAFISTTKGRWYIDLTTNKLYHHSFYRRNPSNHKFNSEYHYQRQCKSLSHALHYINKHDNERYTELDGPISYLSLKIVREPSRRMRKKKHCYKGKTYA